MPVKFSTFIQVNVAGVLLFLKNAASTKTNEYMQQEQFFSPGSLLWYEGKNILVCLKWTLFYKWRMTWLLKYDYTKYERFRRSLQYNGFLL